jgi:hypothetical protein
MLSYPADPEKLKEVLEIEETLRFLFARRGIPTDNEIKTSARLTQKYKALMNWNQQISSGPIYSTT